MITGVKFVQRVCWLKNLRQAEGAACCTVTCSLHSAGWNAGEDHLWGVYLDDWKHLCHSHKHCCCPLKRGRPTCFPECWSLCCCCGVQEALVCLKQLLPSCESAYLLSWFPLSREERTACYDFIYINIYIKYICLWCVSAQPPPPILSLLSFL